MNIGIPKFMTFKIFASLETQIITNATRPSMKNHNSEAYLVSIWRTFILKQFVCYLDYGCPIL